MTITSGYAWLAGLAVANTVVSLFYYLRAIGPMYLERRSDTGPAPAVLSRTAAAGAGLATAAVVAVGILAGPLLSALDDVRLLP